MCTQVLYSLQQSNLLPGSYRRRCIETVLKRSIEQNVYLLDLVDLLLSERYLDFWNAVRESAKPIKDGPDWLKTCSALNPRVYDMYEPELPGTFFSESSPK